MNSTQYADQRDLPPSKPASSGAALLPGANAAATRDSREKHPLLAFMLSFLLPGGGQIYNGDAEKGVMMLLVALVGGLLTVGIVYVVVMIWSMVDAYKVANRERHWQRAKSGQGSGPSIG